MGQRAKRATRCVGCRQHPEGCFCAAIPRLTLRRTALTVIIHHRELRKTTNTGFLIRRSVPATTQVTWGLPRQAPPEIASPTGGARGLVLTPSSDAVRLDALALGPDERVRLYVPDGSWRQAMKMPRRIPALAGLTRVILPPGPPTRYASREETRSFGLATLEAAARALGILEGPETRRALEQVLDASVEATLRARGLDAEQDPRVTSRA